MTLAAVHMETTLQTFLPFPNFAVSAMLLDQKRLGKQRLECQQILSALRNGGGWRNHPAVKMWRGHEQALELYHDACIREWIRRGYVNTMALRLPPLDSVTMPDWLGEGGFHASHRSQLLAKDPEWYGRFGWTEVPGLPYVWPMS